MNKEDILKADKELTVGSIKEIWYERLKINLYIKPLTSHEREQLQMMMIQADRDISNYPGIKSWAFCHSLSDELGNRLFNDMDVEHIDNMNGSFIEFVYDHIISLNFPTDDDLEEAKKNLQNLATKSSGLSLPVISKEEV